MKLQWLPFSAFCPASGYIKVKVKVVYLCTRRHLECFFLLKKCQVKSFYKCMCIVQVI